MLLPYACYSFPIGAVVGGTLAGLAIVAAITTAILCLRKKRRSSIHLEIQPEQNCIPNTESHLSNDAAQPTMTWAPVLSPLNSPSHLYSRRSPSAVSAQQNLNTQITLPSSAHLLIPSLPPTSTTDSADQFLSTTSPPKDPDDNIVTVEQRFTSPQASSASTQLTDEQADFVNSLYNHNIPAPAIARIVQRMMAGQDAGQIGDIVTVGGSSGLRRENTITSVAPPSYRDHP
jgi:hypothetical protein